MLLPQTDVRAEERAAERLGINILINRAIIATTTRNSINVKARRFCIRCSVKADNKRWPKDRSRPAMAIRHALTYVVIIRVAILWPIIIKVVYAPYM
jgi:hypothetical protein